MFPFIAAMEAAAAVADRSAAIADHLASMRCCWPAWHGPRVEDSVHGRCQVHHCIAFNLTHNERRYHMGAPCRIESISPDGLTIIAVVDYPTDSNHSGIAHCAANYNGQRLRLDLTDVWPPVQDLKSV